MNLYLVSQDEINDQDTYDSFVCAAETAYDAIRIHPACNSIKFKIIDDKFMFLNHYVDIYEVNKNSGWANDLKNINVKLIGKAEFGINAGIILLSFNSVKEYI